MFIIAPMNSVRKFLLCCSLLFGFSRSSTSRIFVSFHHRYFCTKMLLINMLYCSKNEKFCSTCIHQIESKKTGKEIRFSVISQLPRQLLCNFLNPLFLPFMLKVMIHPSHSSSHLEFFLTSITFQK